MDYSLHLIKDILRKMATFFFMNLLLSVCLAYTHVVVMYFRLPPQDGVYNAGLLRVLFNPFVMTVLLWVCIVISFVFSPVSLYFFHKRKLFYVYLHLLVFLMPFVSLCSIFFNTIIVVLLSFVYALAVSLFGQSSFEKAQRKHCKEVPDTECCPPMEQ